MSNPPKLSVDSEERRNAPRYSVRTHIALQMSTTVWDAHLLDISATGARVAILDEHLLRPGDNLTLNIELEDLSPEATKKSLRLEGKIVHARDHIIGLELISDNKDEHQHLLSLLDYFSEMTSLND